MTDNPPEMQAIYAKMGEIVSTPQELAKWRSNPTQYHEKYGSSQYDAEALDEILRTWERMPENQMNEIFTDLVRHAERAYRMSLTMSRTIFFVGITIVGVTFLIETLYLLGFIEMDWQTAAAGGGVLGGMGIASIISIFVQGPQKNIQHSIGNLAQVEIAFLSFTNQIRGVDWTKVETLADTEKMMEITSKMRRESLQDIETYLEDHSD